VRWLYWYKIPDILKGDLVAYVVSKDDFSDYIFLTLDGICLLATFFRGRIDELGISVDFRRVLKDIAIKSNQVLHLWYHAPLLRGVGIGKLHVSELFPYCDYLIVRLSDYEDASGFLVFNLRLCRFVGSTSSTFKGVATPELAKVMLNLKEVCWED